ncbi:MAG: hypothetical protein HC834_01925 [Rhodospirillales bacterium]|nr:hypothetical protein [Rhodospirillales bacterium]
MGNAQMIRFAVLVLATLPVYAGPFEDLERAHNMGAPLASVMTESEAARWEGMFRDGRGVARITGARWSAERPQGLAHWSHEIGTKRQSGWLAIQTDAAGKINGFYYTEKPRPRVNNAIAGQSADSATTVVGMASGFVESNPVFAGAPGIAIAAVKVGSTLAIQEYAGLNYCTATSTSLAGADGARARGTSRCSCTRLWR